MQTRETVRNKFPHLSKGEVELMSNEKLKALSAGQFKGHIRKLSSIFNNPTRKITNTVSSDLSRQMNFNNNEPVGINKSYKHCNKVLQKGNKKGKFYPSEADTLDRMEEIASRTNWQKRFKDAKSTTKKSDKKSKKTRIKRIPKEFREM